jgi:hypothetical protein
MQFTQEVQWAPGDFVVAGALLFSTGAALVLLHRAVRSRNPRVALMALTVVASALVWAELAVGLVT